MKTQGKIWVFFNSETKNQSKPLSLVQAQAYLLKMDSENFHEIFLWTPGWTSWVRVSDFLKTQQNYFAIEKPSVPELETPADENIENTITASHSFTASELDADSPYTHVHTGPAEKCLTDYGYYHQDFNGDELDLSKIRKLKKGAKKKKKSESSTKKMTSHHSKIELVLVSKAGSFRSHSHSISLNGAYLETEIPKEFLNQPFDLIIVNPFDNDPRTARLLFRAKIVGDLADARRLLFIELDETMTLNLERMLKSYVESQIKALRAAG